MTEGRRKLTVAAPTEESDVRFFSTGSTLLDLALGGGWAHDRVINLVGDRSTGKTLLAVEACINFAQLPKARARYGEAESAFDQAYFYQMGLPRTVTFPDEPLLTVQDFYADVEKFIKTKSGSGPLLYVLDSLDSLSDVEELENDMGAPSFGHKAKLMAQFFRRLITPMKTAHCTLMIVSQLHDKIGVVFGEKKARSGGLALGYFNSQEVWLAETGKAKRTVLGHERVVGIDVRARVKKNKVGIPFREVPLSLLFNYGIDDEESLLNWLHALKLPFAQLGLADERVVRQELYRLRAARDYAAISVFRNSLITVVRQYWQRIEQELRPEVQKYERAS